MARKRRTAGTVAAALLMTVGSVPPTPAHAGSGQYVRNESGELRCDMLWTEVYCEHTPGYPHAPLDPATGRPFNVAVIDTFGQVRWRTDALDPWPDPEFTIPEGTARHLWGWTVQAVNGGFRFTSDYTGHGGFISVNELLLF